MGTILLAKDKDGASCDELFEIISRFSDRIGKKSILKRVNDVCDEDIRCCDILICVRGQTPAMYLLLKEAKLQQKKVIYFLDDDLKDMPDNTFWYPKFKKWHLKCFSLCDILLTTNVLIAEDYAKINISCRTAIINTAVDAEELVHHFWKDGKIRILYAGSEWHKNDYEKYISPFLKDFLVNNSDLVEFTFFGIKPTQDIAALNNVTCLPTVSFNEYHSYMKTHNFDIGLSPMSPGVFNERKYFNKFIEYSRYGICGIYSDMMPYTQVVRDKINGYLVSGEAENWQETLERLISQRDEIEKCIANAQEYLRKMHSDEQIFRAFIASIPEFCDNSNTELHTGTMFFKVKTAVSYYSFLCREKIYVALFSLKTEGFKGVLSRIKRKFGSEK